MTSPMSSRLRLVSPSPFLWSFSNSLKSFSTRRWSSRRTVIASGITVLSEGTEARQELALEERQEARLVGAHLVEVEVVEAGVEVGLERLDVRVHVRAERHLPGHLL